MTPIMIWDSHADDDLEYVDEVVNFLQHEFGVKNAVPWWTVEYMRWKLGSANPAGRGFMSFARSEGRIIGTATLTKKRILLDGHELIGGEVGDTYTSADFRRIGRPARISDLESNPENYVNKSIFGRLVSDTFFRANADGVTVVYGTPNQNSYPGYTKRLGYGVVRKRNYHSYARPTFSYFMKKGKGLLDPLGPFLSRSEKMISRAQLIAIGGRSQVETTSDLAADAEIDELWNVVRPTKGFSLVRDAHYWRHRYTASPLCNYMTLSFRRKGKLIGIASLRATGGLDGAMVVLSLVEWMAVPELSFDRLLLLAIEESRSTSKPDVINFWGSREEYRGAASRLLFLKRAYVPIILGPNCYGQIASKIDCFDFHIGSSDAL